MICIPKRCQQPCRIVFSFQWITQNAKQTLRAPLSTAARFALLFTLLVFSMHAHAGKAPIYTSFLNNKAVGGYDVVSYYQDSGQPVKGRKKYKLSHLGADWFFASQQNLDAFRQNPDKYLPQYGGYCAYALASGDTVKGDPLQYHIHDDKLYLNFNAKYKKIWLKDKTNFITKADAHWPQVLE